VLPDIDEYLEEAKSLSKFAVDRIEEEFILRHDLTDGRNLARPWWIEVSEDHWWKFRKVLEFGGKRVSLYKYVLPEHLEDLFPTCKYHREVHEDGFCDREEDVRIGAVSLTPEERFPRCNICNVPLGCYNNGDRDSCNCTIGCGPYD
jgi:hypothetical protein